MLYVEVMYKCVYLPETINTGRYFVYLVDILVMKTTDLLCCV